MIETFEFNTREKAIIADNPVLVADKAEYYFSNILNISPDKALKMAQKHVAFSIIRKTEPLYGHDHESLMDLYSELKAIEDAETGADREGDYEGTDEMYKTDEEIKAYILKHNM